MNVGLNLLYLYPNAVGGTETYARGLIESLVKVGVQNKYFLFCSQESAETFVNSRNLNVVKLPVSASNRVFRSLFEIFVFPYYLLKYKIDIVHSLGYSSPLLSPCPTVVNIYDLNWYYHPEDFNLFRRIGWKIFVKSSSIFSTKIITSSYSSKKHIIKILNVPNKKVVVIYGGVPTMKVPGPKKDLKKFKIRGNYMFTLTANVPHKNIMGLLRAHKILLNSGKQYLLVIAGLNGQMKTIALNYIKKEKMENSVITLGWITGKDLATLYKYATIFIIPSLHEGFGFPVLEAFILNTPLVSSNAFSLKEVVGDAGLLFNPKNSQEIAKKILFAMEHPKLLEKLKTLGAERLKKFEWNSGAYKTLRVYNSILKNGRNI